LKIQTTPNVQLNSKKQIGQNQQNGQKADPSFKGAEVFVQALNFLEINQALGATAVDIGCMGIPRTMTDFTRGPEAGLETMRREFSSTIVDAFIGFYGVGAALLISQAFNKKYDVKAHNMLINDETLDITSDYWNKSKDAAKPMNEFFTHVVKNLEGWNTERNAKTGWVGIAEKEQSKIVEKFVEATNTTSKEDYKKVTSYLENLIAGETGSDKTFKLKGNGDNKTVSSLKSTIDDVCKVAKALTKDKVQKTFKSGNVAENAFFTKLKGLNKKTSIIGIAIATALGCSLQPINMYLTRKKTGKTGFVGVEGREPDNSNGFKVLKALTATVAGIAIFSTIGKKPSEVLSKIKFKGVFPTIPQYKFVYGFTIISRLLSARDKNELRESSIKDSLGFVNWLILGGFVSKLAAAGVEKLSQFKKGDFIRYNKKEHNTGLKWLVDAPIVSREEILHSALKKAGISTIKNVNGKDVAMTFKEMMKEATKEAMKNPEMKLAKNKIKYLGFIQMAGYLYSGVVLGVGIPKLNIAITNGIEKKRKAKLASAKATQPTVTPIKKETQPIATQAKA